MVIVANSYMLNIFKQIKIFKLNLGNNFIDLKREKFEIKDGFILKYLNMTGKQIMTYGSIGKLDFYQDFTLSNKEFYVFNDQTVYTINYTNEDSLMVPEDYLASIIRNISEKEDIKKRKDDQVKSKVPSIKLPMDQYIMEMVKKRQLENE
mgnify:CR=1 FL=1